MPSRTMPRSAKPHDVAGTEVIMRTASSRVNAWRSRTRYAVASHDPADPRFDARRYWRGPVWLIVNYMLADGLQRSGLDEVAAEIVADSLALIEGSGGMRVSGP